MTGGPGLLAARREHRRAERAAATDRTLADTAAELRSTAQPFIAAGRPELAAPYLDEAEMFESARSRPPGM